MSETDPLAVPVRDKDGNPICFVCGDSVAEAGHACGPECFQHFLSVVESQQIVVMGEFVDLWNQPWRVDNTQ